MTALSAARNTPKMAGGALPPVLDMAVYTSTTIYQGSLVCTDTAHGYAVPGATSTTLQVWGVAQETVANTGSSGAKHVNVSPGVFKFGNSSAGDAIAQADVGADCYIVDDQTVAKTNGTNTRSRAGTIVQVDADGVWVCVGPYPIPGSTYLTTTNAVTVTNKRITHRVGSDITGDITLTMTSGTLFEIVPGATTAITLPVTANDGDELFFKKPGTESYAVTIGSLLTIPSGYTGIAWCVYLNSAWRLMWGTARAANRNIAVQAAAISFVAGDVTVAVADGEEFDIPTTATNSTVTISTTNAKAGSRMLFRADGTKNGHTVTYRVGSTAITAAATASKRHLCIASYDGTTWVASLSVGP